MDCAINDDEFPAAGAARNPRERLPLSQGDDERERLREVIAGYQRDMLPIGERNVRLAQHGYNQGLVAIVPVVQAQRQPRALHKDYLASLDQYLKSPARLRPALAAAIQYFTTPA